MINILKILKRDSGNALQPAAQDSILCRLMVPKNNEKTPAAAELLFAALHGTLDYASKWQHTMSFEVVSINKFIQFYFYVPKHLKEFVEGQFYAQYPTVEISVVEDYTQKILGEKYVIGTTLQTTKEDVFPIKTFQNFDVDPLSGITGVLTGLDAEDEIWIQVVVSPADDSWQKKGIDYVNNMRTGGTDSILKTIAKGLLGVSQPKPGQAAPAASAVEISGPMQLALKGIEEKTIKLGYKTSIRVASLSPDYAKARQRLTSVVSAFKQFNTVNANGFIQGNSIEGELVVSQYHARELSPNPYILNIEELASVYHLPGVSVETPTMDWAGAKKGEPPQNLPLMESTESENFSIIGKTNFRGEEKEFGMKVKDRALHVYAIGKTGTGKSTLLSNMMLDDIYKGRGVAVVDPHGDLIKDVLDCIPESREDDVVYFSPADRDFPIGFNLLENVNPEYKNIVASGIVGVFKKIFGESWGPRLEYILRNVVLGLLDYPGATLLSILKVLTDTKFRRGVIDKISDPVIKDFFLNEYERYDQKFRTEAVAPIQNKVGQFLSSTVIRNIVGQKNSTVDIREIMDKKKILLIDLSIGKIGEDNSALLGSMMITKIQMAAMSRADLSKEERIPFYLYVDEFQNFATDSFAVILSEARKYGLHLMVTNQYVAQMPETVSNAVFGNVGTIICFRTGAGDAESLQREFLPVFESTDLVNLDNYNIYIKMAIDGITSAPFSAKTLIPRFEKNANVGRIIELSRMKYSKSREEVEEQVSQQTIGSPTSVTNTTDTAEKVTRSKPVETGRADETPTAIVEDQPIGDEQAIQDVPEKLSNYKTAEDYDLSKWYFVNRTTFKDVTGIGAEAEEEVKEKPAEKTKDDNDSKNETAGVGEVETDKSSDKKQTNEVTSKNGQSDLPIKEIE